MMASADAFSVKITGRSAHGSIPQLGISALQVAGGGEYGWHDPHVQIDEDALPYGAAVLSSYAAKWLAAHKK